MITLRVSQRARRCVLSSRLSRRPQRFALSCEILEARQLLSISVFPAAGAGGGGPAAVIVQPGVSVTPFGSSGNPAGLSPTQVKTAYGVNQIAFNGTVTGNGAGQSIAIIDAYYDPSIASNLATFDAQYGLAAPPSFTQYVESGLRSDNSGWALETSLDVEWAHAIAPAASIDLIEADPDTTDLFSAASFASGLSGVSVVSMSFGAGEFSGETSNDSIFTTPTGHNGITFVASSGDSSTVAYPSASPNVLAVGGTTLNVTGTGAYASETGWSGSGGGTSAYESEPADQDSVQSSKMRTAPDVAWDADPNTGVAVYDSVGTGRSPWVVVGGTSVGAPSWSGLIAIADQGRALAGQGSLTNAQLSSDIYSRSFSSDFNDIVTGKSGQNSAGPGYDLVTGLGSPKANLLIPALVATSSAGAAAVTSTGAQSHGLVSVLPHDLNPITPPTSTTNGSGSSSSTGSTSSSNSSITPLTPTILAGSSINGRVVIVVIVVPQPLVANLGPSTTPVTTQAILATVASEEAATTSTHFGQGTGNALIEPDLGRPIRVEKPGPAGIDVIEPFQPDAPQAPPEQRPVPPPNASRARPRRVISETVFDSGLDRIARDLLPGSPLKASTRSEDRPDEPRSSWVPSSTMFSAAAVAMGGYQLALRQSDRFSGRWVPGRPRAKRSAARSFSASTR